jgi:hypothetical protein
MQADVFVRLYSQRLFHVYNVNVMVEVSELIGEVHRILLNATHGEVSCY